MSLLCGCMQPGQRFTPGFTPGSIQCNRELLTYTHACKPHFVDIARFVRGRKLCNTKWPIMITKEFYVLKMKFLSFEFHPELRIEAIGMLYYIAFILQCYFMAKSWCLRVLILHNFLLFVKMFPCLIICNTLIVSGRNV
jgi:hypothetical protein